MCEVLNVKMYITITIHPMTLLPAFVLRTQDHHYYHYYYYYYYYYCYEHDYLYHHYHHYQHNVGRHALLLPVSCVCGDVRKMLR